MKVAIRADASPAIGSGHVMRCLCLADALQAGGATAKFISRALPEHLAQLVVAHGHEVFLLPDTTALHEALDAEQTVAACGPCDWMVLDHYALGTLWETTVRSVVRLVVIDDLDRPHDCDIVLDQNLHSEPDQRYAGRVPDGCTLLLGPRYALLRPEFALARQHVKPRDGEVRHLFVCLGGMDASNITEKVLQAIALVDRVDLTVDVVIGALHPARQRVQALCTDLPDVHCHVQTADMAALLAKADLAIGAGGTATWERCALGVPTLALCIADNQRELLNAASRAGIVYVPDPPDQLDPHALATHLRGLLGNTALRSLLSRNAHACVDGNGARHVAAAMQSGGIVVRRAVAADCNRMHAWRNHPLVRAASRSVNEIDLATHRRWFEQALASANRLLLVGERAGDPIGVVRFDLEGEFAEVSIYLLPQAMGRGHGGPLLLAAEHWLCQEHPAVTQLCAHVRDDNPPSRRLFESSGYMHHSANFAKRIPR